MKIVKYLSIGLITLLLVLVGLALLLFGVAHTPAGQEQIIRVLESKINMGKELQVRIGKIDGIFPHLYIDAITMRDQQGVFLEISKLDLHIRTGALTKGNLAFKQIKAEQIHMLRMPVQSSTVPVNIFEQLSQISSPPLIIQQLDLPQITLDAPILGEKQVYRLSGFLRRQERELILQSSEGTATKAAIFAVKSNNKSWHHDVTFSHGGNTEFTGKVTLEPRSDTVNFIAGGKLTLPKQLTADFTLHGTAFKEGDVIISPLNILYDNHRLLASALITPQDITGDIIGDILMPTTLSPDLLTLTGKRMLVTAQLHLDSKSLVTAVNLAALGNKASLRAHSTLNLQKQHIDKGDYLITTPNITLQGTFSGELLRPHIISELKTSEMMVGTQSIPPITGHIETSITDQAYLLSPITLASENAKISGAVSIDRISSLITGEMKGSIPPLAGLKLGNSTLLLTLKPQDNKQNAILAAQARDITLGAARSQNAQITATMNDLFGARMGTVKGTITGLTQNMLTMNQLTFSASGVPEAINFEAAARGALQEKFTLSTKGKAAITPELTRITLASLAGSYGVTPLSLTRPALLELTDEGFVLSETRLTYGNGNIIGKGSLTDEAADLNLSINAIALSSLYIAAAQNIQGVIDSKLRITGDPSEPEGTALVTVKNFAYRGAKRDFPPINLTGKGTLKNSQLATSITAGLPTGAGAKADLMIPVIFSLSPYEFALEETAPLSGNISSTLALDLLPSLLLLDTQRMSGKAAADLKVSGTLQEPLVNGAITVKNGSYEHLVAGLVVRNLSATILATGKQLTLQQLSANDGANGTITGRGSLHFATAQQSPVSMHMDLQHFNLVRREDLKMRSTGTVSLAGSLKEPTIGGKLTVEQLEFTIPDRSGTKISQLNVTEINLPKGRKPAAEAATAAAIPVNLDLAVAIPGRAMLKGRGLISEWRGNLLIRGTVSDPNITGDLQLVEGTLALIGRVFTLRDSIVRFRGTIPPSPFLDITAETEAEDITTQIKLAGSVRNPEVALKSVPPMPTEEIMSRLLFGQNLKNISPAQAIRLATMTQQLLGGKASGFNVLDRTKEILGVDKVDVRQGSNGDTVLGVGKRIKDNVYIGAEQGLGTAGTAVNIEVEVNPRVTIDSRIGTDSKSGVGINWKKDY